MIRQRTRVAWFAPKSVGLGVRPVTWQGWLATFALVVATWVDIHFAGKGPVEIGGAVAALVMFAVVVRIGGNEQD